MFGFVAYRINVGDQSSEILAANADDRDVVEKQIKSWRQTRLQSDAGKKCDSARDGKHKRR